MGCSPPPPLRYLCITDGSGATFPVSVFPKSVFNFQGSGLLVFRPLLKVFLFWRSSALDSSYYKVVRKLQYKVSDGATLGPFFLASGEGNTVFSPYPQTVKVWDTVDLRAASFASAQRHGITQTTSCEQISFKAPSSLALHPPPELSGRPKDNFHQNHPPQTTNPGLNVSKGIPPDMAHSGHYPTFVVCP